ncbi:MAG TPA: hypothetical protein VKU00_23940 [Chthonomonadaceae bacterium]|nr:hypothetical protein [Chthonomonadaceae bacterium]
MKRSFLLSLGLLLFLIGGSRAFGQALPPAASGIWPNATSRANSDDWLRLHHDQIRQMRPRLLVLNFVNGLSQEAAAKKVQELIAALRESSRYHGYANPDAPPFLDYQVFKIVNLTDPAPLPEDRRLEGNSSLYPRVPNWKEGINFRYGQLFGEKFAGYYQVPDPKNPAHMLTLAEMVERGLVHEVWFLAKQGNYGAPFESIEVKQAYDDNLQKIPGKWVQAGNGGSDEQPWIGRSLRILFMNADRGPGCAMESLGHSIEGTSNSHAIPYFTRYFVEYAGFDLDKRYQLPFNSLYARGGTDVSYPTPDSMTYTWQGKQYTVEHYIPAGNSVHFMPTARRDYDLDNPVPILCTIEHYRLHDGPDGKDRAELWTNAKIARYRMLANDCQGPWLVYWRQNMPGLNNKCRDDQSKPMKNWWPFLFY